MSGAIQLPETRAKLAEQLADRYNDDGSTAAVGLNVFVLAADGRVQRGYTFVDGA